MIILVLVFGGAYQGKLEYVYRQFSLSEDDVHFCNINDTDYPEHKRVVYGLDKWILALIRSDSESSDAVKSLVNNYHDVIFVCDDISCGVVPMEADMRKWREAVGRALAEIAQNSDEVIRMFCGIPTRLK